MMKFLAVLGMTTALCLSAEALAAPAFVNGIAIPGAATDVSGDSGLSGRLGFFSDIYYDPNRGEWYGLADRGPGGGTLSYDTRVERFTIDVNRTTGQIANFNVVETIKFTDPAGLLGVGPGSLNGKAPSPTNILGRAFDPEGFVVNPQTGRYLVSDEYGPSLYEFNRDGTLARIFKTPANLVPRSGSGTPNFANDTGNTLGKRTNRGFEGLAISPNGKFAYAMLQSAMLDEGAGNGFYARIVKFDTQTLEAVAQYAYRLEDPGQGRGISALVAINDHEFLVLERNNRGVGVDSNLASPIKSVFRIDISGASDVSGVTLPTSGALPAGHAAVAKIATVFSDLAANTLAALGNRAPEKLEGLAIGPRLDDGQFLILAGTDNDFSVTQNADGNQFDEYFNPDTIKRIACEIGTFDDCFTVNDNGLPGPAFSGSFDGFALVPGVLYAFRSTGTDLATYVAPVPVPATVVLLGSGLLALGLAARRARQAIVGA